MHPVITLLSLLTFGLDFFAPGRKMAEFPVDPMLAKMIIQSEKFGVSGGSAAHDRL